MRREQSEDQSIPHYNSQLKFLLRLSGEVYAKNSMYISRYTPQSNEFVCLGTLGTRCCRKSNPGNGISFCNTGCNFFAKPKDQKSWWNMPIADEWLPFRAVHTDQYYSEFNKYPIKPKKEMKIVIKLSPSAPIPQLDSLSPLHINGLYYGHRHLPTSYRVHERCCSHASGILLVRQHTSGQKLSCTP